MAPTTSSPLDRPPPQPPAAAAAVRFELLAPRPRLRGGVKRPSSVGLSLCFHLALALALLVFPLFLDESLPIPADAVHAFFVDASDLAPPPPPPPPPPRVARRAPNRAAVPRPAPKAPQRSVDFVAPIEVPEELPLGEGLQIDLGGDGVEGGVAGGVPGGVIGGIVGGLPSPPPPAPADVVRVGGALQPPELLKRVAPRYPSLASQAHIEGIVILSVHVDARGLVKGVKVLRGPKLLDVAAVAAVEQWRYRPLLLNGVPTEFIVNVTVNFDVVTQGSK